MLIRHIFMAFVMFACGIAVSAGTFAFILVIGTPHDPKNESGRQGHVSGEYDRAWSTDGGSIFGH